MKIFFTLILFIVLSLTSIFSVNAQTTESIWLQANTTAYKTGETVTVTLNGTATTPIQGFTAQIRYDPACLQPVNSISPVSGMNGLAVPQTSGLVDMSFASTTPLIINGALAEIRFTTLKGCQTNLTIESAALVIRNESGFAAPLAGININQNAIGLNIDSALGNPQPVISGESALPLAPTVFSEPKPIKWMSIVWLALLAGIVMFIIVLYRFTRPFES
jgi:hypothetical protein